MAENPVTPLAPKVAARKCPWCHVVPDVTKRESFQLVDGHKWGALVCCGRGPEVRTGYRDVKDWADGAIEAWNERRPESTTVFVVEGSSESSFDNRACTERWEVAAYGDAHEAQKHCDFLVAFYARVKAADEQLSGGYGFLAAQLGLGHPFDPSFVNHGTVEYRVVERQVLERFTPTGADMDAALEKLERETFDDGNLD
ncbi:hypothetical protein F6X40_27890 [Paraburkholderia sp. UCT31]|uniref:hypothetical protein n=1 Tax=Paraburkholderia sp. UCT31 TaxID=2615209 RepID=UPI001655A7F2|nr:hypothetical protein [Paraburkholderia sp. UCT31]MBC8740462.1 hypothetical protein [Paraburkholderia sp. UCT31]